MAQKRAEVRKLKSTPQVQAELPALENDASSVVRNIPQEEDLDDLGRWSLRETVERARSTGSLVESLVRLAVNDLRSTFQVLSISLPETFRVYHLPSLKSTWA